MLRAADCIARSAAQFKPAWASSSVSAGSVITLGTFTADGTIIPPASVPYYDGYPGGYGKGNLTTYTEGTTYLFGDSSPTESNNLKWVKMSDSLLVADRNLLCNLSWQNIYKNNTSSGYDNSLNPITTQNKIIGASSGTIVTIDGHVYRVRLLTGGKTERDDCEWKALRNISNLDEGSFARISSMCLSWCSDISVDQSPDMRPLRGIESYWQESSVEVNLEYGFRPALELVK